MLRVSHGCCTDVLNGRRNTKKITIAGELIIFNESMVWYPCLYAGGPLYEILTPLPTLILVCRTNKLDFGAGIFFSGEPCLGHGLSDSEKPFKIAKSSTYVATRYYYWQSNTQRTGYTVQRRGRNVVFFDFLSLDSFDCLTLTSLL